MKQLLESMLFWFARQIVKKYKPFVIAITGSVGKTSAKEAIYLVMNHFRRTRTALKNYNNELGVPLTVIGGKAGGRNPFAWLLVFLRATWLLIWRDANYAECLVLEYGADHPGDIQKLMKLIQPQIGVLTGVSAAHTEFFGSVEAVAKEKGYIVEFLPSNGTAIINGDFPHAVEAMNRAPGAVVFYGFDDRATVRGWFAVSSYDWENKKGETSLECSVGDEREVIKIKDAVGVHSGYAPLAALAVAQAAGHSIHEAAEVLQNYRSPNGRMKIIPGIKGTLVVDDSYNSSPSAAKRALEGLLSLKPQAENGKRFAVLGGMAELGELTVPEHRAIGAYAAKLKVDVLVCVGEKPRDIARGALESGMAENCVYTFASTDEAGRFVQERIHQGDIILVKGSQSARMERVTKELMAEPNRAEELLVRFDKDWVGR